MSGRAYDPLLDADRRDLARPRGVDLMAYQRRLALEQQETARRKLMRQRYDRAAAERKIL